MKKLLLPIAAMAIIMVPAAANGAPCRDSATGKFAKCGTPGSVPASQYVAKGKASPKKAMAAPAPTTTKSSMMSMFKPKPKATPAAMAMPMAKPAKCKTAKGKFVKCGTPGAKPA